MTLLLLQACEDDMRVITPIEITDANYTNSIPEPDASVGEAVWEEIQFKEDTNPSVSISETCFNGSDFVFIESGSTAIRITSGDSFSGSSVFFDVSSQIPSAPAGITYGDDQYHLIYQSGGSTPTLYTYSSIGAFASSYSLGGGIDDTPLALAWNGSSIAYFYNDDGVIKVDLTTEVSGRIATYTLPVDILIQDATYADGYYYLVSFSTIYKYNEVFELVDSVINEYQQGLLTGVSNNGKGFTTTSMSLYTAVRFLDDLIIDNRYAIGDEVISTTTHKVYSCIIPTTDEPEIGAAKDTPTWIEIGATNKYSMFDANIGNPSTSSANISSTLTIGTGELVTSVSGFGISNATSVTVEVYDSETIYYQTIDMTDKDSFGLIDLPAADNAEIIVTARGTDIEVGELVFGDQTYLGVTQYGSSYQLTDYSRVDRDDFGNVTIVKRGTADLMTFAVKIDADDFASVRQTMEELRATPAVWVGDDLDASKTVYGIYKDLTINWSSPSVYDCSFKIEGLT